MADSVPGAWRTAFRCDGGQFVGVSGMLSAMAAVDNIIHGVKSKDNIWAVNAEEEYHEAAAQMHDQE